MAEQVIAEKVEQPEAPAPQPAQPKEHWWDRLIVPVLAVITALAIGALVIVFSDTEILKSWSGFFLHPLDALRV